MYKGKTTGLGDVWKAYTLTLAQHCTGQNQRLTVESYTLPFPCTLSLPVKTRTVAFHCDQSAPSVINTGLAGVEDRLILVLVEVLNRDFSARLHPVSDGQRVAAKGQRAKDGLVKCTVIGASHMQRVARLLAAQGISVTDMTVPGWVANTNSIESLTQQLEHFTTEPGSVVILDLVSNSSVKFRQADDALAEIAYKLGRAG
jgi:hypothetical protein